MCTKKNEDNQKKVTIENLVVEMIRLISVFSLMYRMAKKVKAFDITFIENDFHDYVSIDYFFKSVIFNCIIFKSV